MEQIRSLIIVLHHLHLDQLDLVLKELKRTCIFDSENRIMIIDSPSTPESRKYLSDIDWADILLTANEYWQRSCWNQGFRRIHAKYYITCHTDIVKMEVGWREVMLNYLDANSQVGAIVAHVPTERPGFQTYVGTCLTAYRRACLEDIGIFDEEFDPFFNYDDEEWSFRARTKGWKMVMLDSNSGTAINHMWGQSGNYFSWNGNALCRRKIQQSQRNDLEYLAKVPAPSGLVSPSEFIPTFGPLVYKYQKSEINKLIEEWVKKLPKEQCTELLKYMKRWVKEN